MITSDKSEILDIALKELLDVYLEGAIFNNDVYGYWSLLENDVFNCSLFSFRQGLTRYHNALVCASSPDLINCDIKLRVRLLNNEFILAATNEVISTFQHNVKNTLDPKLSFDFTADTLIGFERVLFLFFIYSDKIRLNALSTVNGRVAQKKTR